MVKISEVNKLKALKYAKTGVNVAYIILRLALLLSIGFIILYPLLYMIITSIMSPMAFANSTRVWIPTELNIRENYDKAIEALAYGKSFLNTIKIEIVSALLEVVSCSVIGYGFARFNFKGKKHLQQFCF